MKKSELKTGMIGKLRNGDIITVCGDKIISGRTYNYIKSYDYDLTYCPNNEFDIMEIYSVGFPENKLLWKRDEIKKLEIKYKNKEELVHKLIEELMKCSNLEEVFGEFKTFLAE